MTQTSRAAQVSPLGMGQLCALLEEEAHQYDALLRLAQEQGRLMEAQDTERLAENTRQWQQILPAADALRIRREHCAAALLREIDPQEAAVSLTSVLPRLTDEARAALQPRLARVRQSVVALARQNELNRRLAAFCLDLVAEEAAIFRRGVLEDPAGCYDGDAQPTKAGPGGVLVRQA